MRNNDDGFTLIELLIVIVILGILSAVVVFAVGGVTDQGQDSACSSDLKIMEVAVEAYRAQEGSYPVAQANIIPGFMRSASLWYQLDTVVGNGAISYTVTGATVCAAVPP